MSLVLMTSSGVVTAPVIAPTRKLKQKFIIFSSLRVGDRG